MATVIARLRVQDYDVWREEYERMHPVREAHGECGRVLYRDPDEPNLVLTTTYANMAALDNLDARVDPIVQQVMGRDRAQSAEAGVQRGPMRRLIGDQLYRQLLPQE